VRCAGGGDAGGVAEAETGAAAPTFLGVNAGGEEITP